MAERVASSNGITTRASLGWLGASWGAIVDSLTDFYPRLGGEGRVASLTSGEIVRAIDATVDWDEIDRNGSALDDAIELAKCSLAEVKAQTEYQDQKATRLLTVTTFLSALSGVLFASLSTAYPVRTIGTVGELWQWALVLITYATFLLFVLAALLGALVTFHATRTRFKYPDWTQSRHHVAPVGSHLFFQVITHVPPENWATSFVVPPKQGTTPTVNEKLKARYLHDYVGETYLIASKTADKVRYLEPAQSLLALSLRFLIAFVVLVALSHALIDPISLKPPAVRTATSEEPFVAPAPAPANPTVASDLPSEPLPGSSVLEGPNTAADEQAPAGAEGAASQVLPVEDRVSEDSPAERPGVPPSSSAPTSAAPEIESPEAGIGLP